MYNHERTQKIQDELKHARALRKQILDHPTLPEDRKTALLIKSGAVIRSLQRVLTDSKFDDAREKRSAETVPACLALDVAGKAANDSCCEKSGYVSKRVLPARTTVDNRQSGRGNAGFVPTFQPRITNVPGGDL